MFIFNIFTGAVIFLILSLKIEKTSSTFQEKKLRREMGEIITEFNSTAERNITLLENRISVLKKLLNEKGSLKGIDFTVLDDKMKNNSDPAKDTDDYKKPVNDNVQVKEMSSDKSENKIKPLREESNIIGTFLDKIQSFNKVENIKIKDSIENDTDGEREFRKSYDSSSIIEREIKDLPAGNNHIDLSVDEEISLTYERVKEIDIEQMFNDADDKYLLIAQLFNDGHSVEEISRYSGMPAGEIKLVISLNS